jgi:hypothetical protein
MKNGFNPIQIGKKGQSNSTDDLQKQIENAKFRLESMGVESNPDSRNWFEKATNLEEDQNWFFDALDLIDRPRQALTNFASAEIQNQDNRDPLKALTDGFAGRREVHGKDFLQNIENPIARGALGFGIDVLSDPLTYTPAGVFKAGGSLLGKTAKAITPEQVQQGARTVKQGVGEMFGGKYANMTPEMRKLNQAYDNSEQYMMNKAIDETSDLTKTYSTADGKQVARLQEKDLKWTEDVDQLTEDLLKGREFKTNLYEGELPELVTKLNELIQTNPKIKSVISKTRQGIDKTSQKINDLSKEFDFSDIMKRGKGELTEAELKASEQLIKLNQRRGKLESDLKEYVRGIYKRDLGEGKKGFELVNNKGRMVSKALGGVDEVVEAISPKKSFDELTGNTALVSSAKPVIDELLQEGKITLKNTSENANIINSIAKAFRDDIKITRGSKNYTISLKDTSKFKNTVDDFMDGFPIQKQVPKALDELQFTDRMTDVNVPRPKREYSTKDDEVLTAKLLDNGYEEIRNLASDLSRGLPENQKIDIDDMVGYMKHIWSEVTKEMKDPKRASSGKNFMGGNSATTKTRGYKGSVEDIAEREGTEMFNPDAFFSSAIGRQRLVQYIHAESFKNHALKRWGKPFKVGMDVPKDHVVIRPKDFDFFPTKGGQLAVKRAEEYIVPKPIARALQNYKGKFTDDGVKNFMEAFGKLNNTWKKFALFSVGFHVRNFLGNNFNMWISGMSPDELVRYQTKAVSDLRRAKEAQKLKNTRQVLTAEQQKALDDYDEFLQQGLREGSMYQNEFMFDPDKAVKDRLDYQRKSTTGKIGHKAKRPFETSRDIGTGVDEYSRYALYQWGKKKGMTKEGASDLVRKTLYDYSDLSNLEKNIKHVVPFYTWMRKNIPFQLKNFLTQPKKYAGVEKARQAGLEMTGMDDENLPDWLKESLAIPIQGDGEGNGNLLGFNLPASDLTQLSDPMGMFTNSLTPLAKLPVELGTNFDTFRGKPIEDFEGESGEVFGMDVGAKPAHAINQLLGSFGNISRRVGQEDQQDTLENILLGGMRKPVNMEQQQFFNTLEELQQLQDLIRKYKQDTGGALPTKRELEKQGNLFQFLDQ